MHDERPFQRHAVRSYDTIAPELRQVVLSPEQVELHLPIAGPTSRMLAYGIDAVIIFAVEAGLFALVLVTTSLAQTLLDLLQTESLRGLTPQEIERLLNSSYALYLLAGFVLAQFVIELVYFSLWETVWSGRSLGKAIMQLRVVSDGGRALTLRDSVTRNLLRIVDLLPSSYLVGLTAMLLSSEGKRLGDLAAGTVVIRLDRPPAPQPLPQIEASTFRFDRTQTSRIGPLDRQLILETLRRIDTLPPEHGSALLERTVEVMRQRIDYGELNVAERRAFLLALLNVTGGA